MIYLIITTTINNKYGIKNIELREKQYTDAINSSLQLLPEEIKPIIVENSGLTNSFLDKIGVDIVYTNNNLKKYTHKGHNELLDIKDVIKKYNINDDDIIVKLTGRYTVLSDYFFKIVKLNQDKDLIMKFFNVSKFKFIKNDCIMGLFALKCKYFKDFNYSLKFRGSIEVEFATYLRKIVPNSKILEIPMLFLECCFAENNTRFKY